MATYSFTGGLDLTFAASLTKTDTQNSATDALRSGLTNFGSFAKSLTNGTSSGQATNCWHERRTLTAGSNDDLNLNSGALTNMFAVSVAFTRVVWVVIRIVTPAASTRLVVGAAAANPWQAWFGATTHTEEVRDWMMKVNQIDAWTVSAGSAVLRINNPIASSVIYDIAIVGSP